MKLSKKTYTSAQKIFINGIIYSIDRNHNIYESMAIRDGIIIALGSNEELSCLCSDETQVIDLRFRIVLPGFIDAHCQIPGRMMIGKDELSLFEAGNSKDYLKLIQSYIDTHPERKIIYGVGWKKSAFEKEEENINDHTEAFKGPNKKWFEMLKTHKPIVLKSCDGYVLWLNDKALKYYGITKDTNVPIGGKIELDEQGELWGTLKGNEVDIVYIVKAKEMESYKDDEYLSKFIKYQNILHSYGITTIGLINDERLKMKLETYKKLEEENKLKLRINYGVTIKPEEICKKTIFEQMHHLKRRRILYKTDLFDISIAKFFSDGLIEDKTAYLFRPYEQINKESYEENGMFLWNYQEFKEGIKMANRLDFNVCIHAVGDLACKLSIDGIEYSLKTNINRNFRNSLLHIDLITKYYIQRMKNLNINAIIRPSWFYKDMSVSKNEVMAIGEVRAHRQYPIKSLIDSGIITAGSSDNWDIERANPLKAIECSSIRNLYDFTQSGYPEKINMTDMRYRLNPSERISVIESVKMFTINAAYALGKEKDIGSLEVEKKADLIVLDKNIFLLNPLDISNINIERTYFNGELVYLNE
ncbi:amidohydrolase [Clostridium chromiireducens]|uniref:Amidohydrolase n=1 Tax=Clostridium chromiireducens TaxID=225345 RepID=A0A399INV7_9CLOT|nr:amidohydrolase [Clostridium chromiireducens]RII34641.1 amidohydrolase [Clostridium chromiireducens]